MGLGLFVPFGFGAELMLCLVFLEYGEICVLIFWNMWVLKISHTIFFPHPMVAKCYNKFIILPTPPFDGFIYTIRRDEGGAGILSALMVSSVISQIKPSGGAMP